MISVLPTAASLSLSYHRRHYGDPAEVGWGLKILSKAYEAAIRLWSWAYDSGLLPTHRVGVPVISIGNITTGGTGKTPVTQSLAIYLESLGLTVGVLSRGFGAQKSSGAPAWVTSAEKGDEAFLIQQTLTRGWVMVGRDRVKAAQQMIAERQPDVILLDDGFQHRRLGRDIDIVLLDAHKPFGNGYLLPAGPLREPVLSLKRATQILITKGQADEAFLLREDVRGVGHIVLTAVPFESRRLYTLGSPQVLLPMNSLHGHAVTLISGIAHPHDFESSVAETLGVSIEQHHVGADHQVYTEALVSAWLSAKPSGIFVTTEKDAVKLLEVWPSNSRDRVYVLGVTPVIDWASLLGADLARLGLTPREVAS